MIGSHLASMRVLHFASWHPNEVHPQLGNFVRRHISAIPSEVESRVIHAWPGISGDEARVAHLNLSEDQSGIRTHFLPVKNAKPRRWRMAKAYNRFCERLTAEDWIPDLIHLHIAAEAAAPAAAWAKKWNVPLVVSEHWTAYHNENGRDFRPAERRAIRKTLNAAALHLPVSDHLGEAMARYAKSVPYTVVPNVVDPCFLAEEPRFYDTDSGPLRLLHVSSLVDEHKNIFGMLRAVGQAVEKGVDLSLDVYGGAGEGQKEIPGFTAFAKQLKLADRVHFHGPISAREVAHTMRESEAFVLFSRYENLPCVLLEAWCTGLPVVATNVGGVGEHLGVQPQLGIRVESEDEAALTGAILDLARRKSEGNLFDSKAIAAYAEARFTTAAVGGQILEAYRSVLE